MSHFTVIVAIEPTGDTINVDEALAKALAPFDENMDVAAYREYEDGEPADHWIYEALKRHADEHATGTGIKPYDPDASTWDALVSRLTVEEQREDLARLASIYHSLQNPPTWEDVVYASLKWFGEENDLQYDHETGRAYTVSTYNPESKWDWYTVGGRWTGYFKIKPGAVAAEIVNGKPGLMTPPNRDVFRCDGGKKGVLDLEAMRDEAGDEAGARYDRYHALVAGWPEAKPWKHFVALVDAEDGDYSIEQAREDYANQRRVKLLKGSEFDVFIGPDAIEEYAKPRELIVEQARASAVPGYAVLTHDGKWLAPGKMGWFGMSSDDESDRNGYLEVANAYLDSLPDDTWLVQVDCHI